MRAITLRPLLALALTTAIVAGCSKSTAGSSSSGLTPAGANHSLHLRSGVYSAGMSCDNCHGPNGFVVDFSQNSMVQAADATFDPVTKTCSNVACHGNFGFNGVIGSHAVATWNDPTPLSCTSCHGMPPTGHPAYPGKPDAASCAACHVDSVNANGTINVGGGTHLNLKAEVTGGTCSSCHGEPTRVGSVAGTDPNLSSAPPIAPAGSPGTAVGAHLAHLNPNPAALVAAPVACAECHVVPTDAAHATTPPVQKVVFGPLARARGASPSYVAGSAGCAASYCHGTFAFNGVSGSNATPVWTDTTPVGCASCHGMPPTGHPAIASGAATAASCAACHPQSVNADGTVVAGGTHLDGKADLAALGCTACHGDAARIATLSGADVNLLSSPPVATTNAPASAVGAHLGHVNPSLASALMGPVACKIGRAHV